MEENLEEKLVQTEVLPKKSWRSVLLPTGVILLIILAGVGTGFLLVKKGGVKMLKSAGEAELIQGPNEVGIKDEKVFRDSAEGKLEINDGSLVEEGSHRLIRPGGESQTVYLSSSVVDLNQFTGRCVKVWGETFSAQKAGWLMDVGRVRKLDDCPEGL